MENLNIENINEKDKVIIDGFRRSLHKFTSGIKVDVRGKWIPIEEVVDDIESIVKYYPIISFGGSSAYVTEYVKDEDGKLVYLRMSGQDQHVKAISSVIMIGHVSMKDDYLSSNEIREIRVHSDGNKRIIKSFGEGIVDCIVYNYNSISGQKRNILIGEDEEDIFNEFLKWNKSSVKYPVYKELNREFFQELKDRNLIFKAQSSGTIAYVISSKLVEDDFLIFREIELSLVEHLKVTPVQNMANSSYLSKKQVEHIYKTLSHLPDPYETDGQKIKAVGLKLFGPSMTYYVVESNKDNRNSLPYDRCFGYVKNEHNPESSEWGYFDINEILEVEIPIGMNIGNESRNIYVGFEMDLHFKDKYITYSGKILDKTDI